MEGSSKQKKQTKKNKIKIELTYDPAISWLGRENHGLKA